MNAELPEPIGMEWEALGVSCGVASVFREAVFPPHDDTRIDVMIIDNARIPHVVAAGVGMNFLMLRS
jgi:hypothetical protein